MSPKYLRAVPHMTNNSNILQVMKKKLGHYRQYSTPQLYTEEYPNTSKQPLLRSTAENLLSSEATVLLPPSTLLSAHGIISQQTQSINISPEQENELKLRNQLAINCENEQLSVLKATHYELTDQQERHGVNTLYRRSSLPAENTSEKEGSKPLDNLTREELIEKLERVEKELAKTKKSPMDKSDLKDDPANQERFDCLWNGCHKTFVMLEVLISHIGQEHIGSGKPSYRCEWHGCSRSQKPFMKRHKMYNHMRTHTGERPFQCPIPDCGKRFSRPDSLATHVKTHSNVRPYICAVPGCKKAYYHSRSLRKHTKGHEMLESTQECIQSYQNGLPQEIMYYGSQPYFDSNGSNIPHQYQPESLFFSAFKPTEIAPMNNYPSAESFRGSELLSSSVNTMVFNSTPFAATNLQIQPIQALPGIFEPSPTESHPFSETSTTEYPLSSNTSSLVSDTMVNPSISTQSHPIIPKEQPLSFPSQLIFGDSSASSTKPTASQW